MNRAPPRAARARAAASPRARRAAADPSTAFRAASVPRAPPRAYRAPMPDSPAWRPAALHHVQIAMPPGGEGAARDFYGALLGLTEVAKPAALAGRGGVWFEDGALRVHLGVEHGHVSARKAHPAFAVQDLAAARARLAARGPTEVEALPGLTRFYMADPFGNRIEILETE